jgi:ketosteroid isomerase-like protein
MTSPDRVIRANYYLCILGKLPANVARLVWLCRRGDNVTISETGARELIYALHDAWNRRNIEALLALYVDDVTYWANVGGPDGGPLVMSGKPALHQFCMMWKDFDCLAVPENFHFKDGICRCHVEFYIRDPNSGLQHASTYRQIATYRGGRILRLEQYHDANAMAAFLSIMGNGEPAR